MEKVSVLLRTYGIFYTIRKILDKLYIGYIAGRTKVNRNISASIRAQQEDTMFPETHCISILVPLYNTPERYLREMITSVVQQTYSDWQLCMADGSDEDYAYVKDICREYAENDERICYQKLSENKGISENTNACISMATGDYIALFDHDDLLHPSALYEVMSRIVEDEADFIYTDEATFLGKESHLLSVHTKPDFYIENLRANNYICHFTVFKKTLLEQVGLFRKEFDGSQDHDMILRLCEKAANICHISRVLYFWRAHLDSVALALDSKGYAADAGRRAVQSHLERSGLEATVSVAEGDMLTYDVIYEYMDISKEDICICREGDSARDEIFSTDKRFILLMQRDVEVPEDETLYLLWMHMVKPEVGAVTAPVVNRKKRIVSAQMDRCEKNGKVFYKEKYYNYPESVPGYMSQLTYAAGIQVISRGGMLIRREYLEKYFGADEDLFARASWIRVSERMREDGIGLIREGRGKFVDPC